MKPYMLLIGLLIFGFNANAQESGSLTAEELFANQELDKRFVDGMSQKDIEKVMSCLWNNPNLILVDFDGNVFRGYESVRKVFEQFFDQSESIRLVIDEISHIRAGESVFAVGTATYQLQALDGTSQQITERWTDVRTKVDGRWVYALDHIHFLTSKSL